MAEAIYVATELFCQRFYRENRRMTDQMVQAARSGVRNISEGSGASATSRKSEMLLTNVALASLKMELLPDYEHFLHMSGFSLWDKNDARTLEMRRRLGHAELAKVPPPSGQGPSLRGWSTLPDFVREAQPELAANAMICTLHLCTYLLTPTKMYTPKALMEF